MKVNLKDFLELEVKDLLAVNGGFVVDKTVAASIAINNYNNIFASIAFNFKF